MQTNKPFLSARQLARCAMIAAVYTVLCLSFAPLAFRAGAAALLPKRWCCCRCLARNISWPARWGAFCPTFGLHPAGCGLRHPGHPAGLPGHLRSARQAGAGPALPAALPPILANALIVGPELAFFFFPDSPATPATDPVERPHGGPGRGGGLRRAGGGAHQAHRNKRRPAARLHRVIPF